MSDYGVTISGHKRRIPVTMATQHPDNATRPGWSRRSDARITLEMEGEEAYRNFRLGIDETMWDNEGKHADYGIGLKLVESYHEYFSHHQIGRDVYITYRIPNRWKQKGGIHRHALTAIAAENETLASYDFHTHAFFEVILPFTEDQYQLLGVQMDYIENTSGKRVPEYLELIPLIEGAARVSDVGHILDGYVAGMKRIWGVTPGYVRPFIARSDPALDSGLVAADLFVLGAVSECWRFAKRSGIPVYPIIGAGSATFRGGLRPDCIDSFVAKYPGFRTVTVQSAFRYDYPEEAVKTAVARLGEVLSQSEARVFEPDEMRQVVDLTEVFARPYKATVTRRENGRMPVADSIIDIAEHFIPSNRERAGHVGYFGYSRPVEQAEEVALPRAIKYVAALMTLGVPPEVIGMASGLASARERGMVPVVEGLLPHLQNDLADSLAYVNLDALDLLARSSDVWSCIRDDVTAVEGLVGVKAGPRSPAEVRHAIHTRNFVELYLNYEGDPDIASEMRQEAHKAAELRQHLG